MSIDLDRPGSPSRPFPGHKTNDPSAPADIPPLTLFSMLNLKVSAPTELLWALIGLILTIGGTLIEASMMNAPWLWSQQGVTAYGLGVSYQIAAVLLVACLGGKNAGLISQLAYLMLGLTWLDVFTQGGGLDYVKYPSFGYILGFAPGAWVCGTLAFQMPPRLESIALSCVSGLAVIHGVGLTYLTLGRWGGWLIDGTESLWQQVWLYSVHPLPGQLAIACAVTVLAVGLRRLMFY
jgi:biotin transport system substrate-specific component